MPLNNIGAIDPLFAFRVHSQPPRLAAEMNAWVSSMTKEHNWGLGIKKAMHVDPASPVGVILYA